MRWGRTMIAGLLTSFIGALPLGSLNITAFQLSMRRGKSEALWFSLAVILIELTVVGLMFWGAKKWVLSNKTKQLLLPAGALLLLYLGTSHLLNRNAASAAELSLPEIESAFLLGLMLSSLNPLQFPFWMAWNKYYQEKGWFKDGQMAFLLYLSGIGIGTFAGLWLFILLGFWSQSTPGDYQGSIELILGLLYLAFGLYFVFLALKNQFQPKLP